MIFDVTSEHTSKKFLSDFLDIDIKQIDDFIQNATDDIFVDEFLEYIDRTLVERDIDKLSLVAIHITTNDDNAQSIRDVGLVNLQHALTMDTPLSRYLKSYDISFDIYNNLMCINDRFHELEHDSLLWDVETPKGKLNDVARKIYSYHQINGYFCIRDLKKDGEDIHLRPEIIESMSKLGKNPTEFESKWANRSKPYMVKFTLPIEYFAHYSFYESVDAFKDDYVEKLVLKKWLVEQAITVIWNHYHYGECSSKIEACLKPEISVSPKYITEIKEII